MKEIFQGIYNINQKIATLNSAPGTKPFNEILVTIDGKEYRQWDPNRSKASAAIAKGIKQFPIGEGCVILYLGIAHGFTASYFSDIIGPNGVIYGVEFSDRCFNELLSIVSSRRNIIPILADARKPEDFVEKVIEKVDVVYVDIAQPDATEVAIRNCKKFLKPRGYLMFTIKTQSVDVTQSVKLTVKLEIEKIAQAGFEIIDWKMLDPFEECHGFVLARLK
ncbi:MAG: fibrillarin-like rRNA/tRNA 2'-O-methyltransferase [Nanoarchaeota archaeon]|nr:fibrillarin-like rRNA/tRNA 2'-O-methyltransferase [Nanoarchaeota archaeon]MBU4124242.1 fibrillarin-like rRNA/tRNA 2'-O-methyltransferase [Nanoarchaeota archaeon]